MLARTLFVWLIPSLCLAYNPPAAEILSKMETTLRRPEPVSLQVVREPADEPTQLEHQVRVPADSTEDAAVSQDFNFPFSSLTLPGNEVLKKLPSIADGNAAVKLDRVQGYICYLIEGRSERIWLRKSDYVPLKVESLSHSGEWTAYVYLELLNVSKDAVYPSRTEVLRNGSLVIVERLVPARAATDKP